MKHHHFLLAMCVFLLTILACSRCREEKLSQAISPDGKLVIIVEGYRCSAQAKDVTLVSLRSSDEQFNRPEDLIYVLAHQHTVEGHWIDNALLSIHCSCRDEDVRLKVVKKGKVTILYK